MKQKTREQICPKVPYKKTEKGIIITGGYDGDATLVLPDEIEGEPVAGIDDYAFARAENLKEIWLPSFVTEIGRYAFYRCRELKKLILTDSLLDIGGGAFTGCGLSEVEIHFQSGEKSCLKSIVDEIRFAIRAELYYKNGVAKVLFPEHYEEAVENTPARILVTHHHGAGGYYRQCFYNRELDYKKYDELLFRTVVEEEPNIAAELVLNRLRYPFHLERKSKEAYEQYLKEHLEEGVKFLVETEDLDGFRFFCRENYWTEKTLGRAMEFAAQAQKTEILSFLMDEKHRRFPIKKKTFEL